MGKAVVKCITLREQLDRIDSETIRDGAGSFWEAKICEQKGMWRKGWAIIKAHPEILEYEGGRGGDQKNSILLLSWASLERETGRSYKSIQKWVKLCRNIKAVGEKPSQDEKVFDLYQERRSHERNTILLCRHPGKRPL